MSKEKKDQLPLHQRSNKEFLAVTLGGSLLAMSSGMLNATTVGSDRQLSSQPMTGTSTMIGISAAEGDSSVFGDKIGILLFHILGACVSGYLVPHRTFYMGSDYGRLLKISLVVLTGAFLVSKFTPDSIFWYYLVAFAGGVQNAMTSKYSGNILRTTHISGSVTDMGLIIGRRNFSLKHPMWKFYINLSIVSCYFIGAVIGGYTLKSLEDNQLLINICLYGVIIVLYFIFVKKEKEYRCCFELLGLTNSEIEEEYNTKGEPSAVPLSESQIVEVEKGNIPLDNMSPSSAQGNDEVDSDDEEDEDEPKDNQITEEDLEDMAKKRLSGGQIVTTSEPHDDVESSDVSKIELLDVNRTDSNENVVKSNGDVESLPVVPISTVVVDSKPVSEAKKEMEDAWTFRVMMMVVCTLCFNAAFINATTKLSSKGILTSHITGATTKLALAISDEDWVTVSVRAIIIALYAFGAMITGSVVKSDFYSLRAPYKRLFLFGTLLLVLGLLLHIYFPDAHYFYYCMALFCGMQSALGCKVKSTVLRTCYMSGTATDIGAAIGKISKLGSSKAHLRPLQLLVPCLVSYIIGAFVAKLLFPVLGKYNTCVNIGIFALLSALYWCFQHPRKVKLWLTFIGVKEE